MKRTLPALILVMALPFGVPAQADMDHMNHGGTPGQTSMGAMMSEGTVKKVDKAQGKLTIKHGELANLNMPPMTMVFRVSDPAMLNQVKPGDAVHFRADRMNGVLTVTRIESDK